MQIIHKLSEKYIKNHQFIDRKNKKRKKLKNMLTYTKLHDILNTTKEERTKQDHQEERQESQGEI